MSNHGIIIDKEEIMEYVALPEQIYNEVRRFLGNQPYDMVKNFIESMESAARYVEQIGPDPRTVVAPQAATETATGEISSTGN